MTAIIRVKRRLEDDPLEAVLLSFKKRRTDADADDENSKLTLLRFTGTVDHKNDEETIPKALHTLQTKSSLLESLHKGTTDFVEKRRNESRKQSKENRFKILSCNRRTIPGSVEGAAKSNITIVDVDNELPDEEQAPASSESKYVYDLYSTDFLGDDGDVHDGYLEGLVSVQPFSREMEYRGSEDSEEIDPYEEDSNDESNWRNDYPDSDHSINEDDMRLAASLHGMGIDHGYDLSSDESDVPSDLYKMLEKHRKKNGLIDEEVNSSLGEDDEDDDCNKTPVPIHQY